MNRIPIRMAAEVPALPDVDTPDSNLAPTPCTGITFPQGAIVVIATEDVNHVEYHVDHHGDHHVAPPAEDVGQLSQAAQARPPARSDAPAAEQSQSGQESESQTSQSGREPESSEGSKVLQYYPE